MSQSQQLYIATSCAFAFFVVMWSLICRFEYKRNNPSMWIGYMFVSLSMVGFLFSLYCLLTTNSLKP